MSNRVTYIGGRIQLVRLPTYNHYPFNVAKGAPIMLEIYLLAIPSSTSQKIYPLFLFYAFIITYYSHKILSGYIACRQFWSCKTVSQCKCCWCSSETSTLRSCISAERSINSNRTVSSPVYNRTTDCSIRVYQSFQQSTAHSSFLSRNHLIRVLNHCYHIMPKTT